MKFSVTTVGTNNQPAGRHMKISRVQTETRTVRVESKKQLDLVCDSTVPSSGVLILIWKAIVRKLRALFARLP